MGKFIISHLVLKKCDEHWSSITDECIHRITLHSDQRWAYQMKHILYIKRTQYFSEYVIKRKLYRQSTLQVLWLRTKRGSVRMNLSLLFIPQKPHHKAIFEFSSMFSIFSNIFQIAPFSPFICTKLHQNCTKFAPNCTEKMITKNILPIA